MGERHSFTGDRRLSEVGEHVQPPRPVVFQHPTRKTNPSQPNTPVMISCRCDRQVTRGRTGSLACIFSYAMRSPEYQQFPLTPHPKPSCGRPRRAGVLQKQPEVIQKNMPCGGTGAQLAAQNCAGRLKLPSDECHGQSGRLLCSTTWPCDQDGCAATLGSSSGYRRPGSFATGKCTVGG